MKNTKAICLIILGAFLLAAGSAFAGSYDQLTNNPFGGGKSSSISGPGDTRTTGGLDLKAAAPAPAPTPAPSVVDTIKGFLADNSRNIVLGALGGFIGFALFGPAGIVLGALCFLALGTL